MPALFTRIHVPGRPAMSPLRIGVMGCADIAWRAMIPAMIECEETSLIAVASRTQEKAHKFAAHFKCDAVTGYDQLLRRNDIDAIYMPLPTGLHEVWVTKTLEAGKHLLVEKSFAEDLASAKKMLDLAEKKKLLVLENFLFPHHSQHAWILDKISSGELGEIHLFRATFGFPPLQADNFRYDRRLGGGALLDAGAYVVKAAQIFMGTDLRLRGASLKYDAERGVDIHGNVLLENSRGQAAQLSFGFDYYYQCQYEFLGSKGKLVAERAFTPPPGFTPSLRIEHQGRKHELSLPADNHYVNMLRFFARTVRDGGDPGEHLQSILRQAEWLDLIRREGSR